MAKGATQETPVSVEAAKGRVVAAKGPYNRAWIYMSSSSGVVWDAVVILKRGNSATAEFAVFDAYDVGIDLKAAGVLLNALLIGLALERVAAQDDAAYRVYYGPLRMYYFANADRAFVVDLSVVYRLGKRAETARKAESILYGEEKLAAIRAFLRALS